MSVPLYNARVQVSLRPSVLDPAGEATRAAAGRLGVSGVRRQRLGRHRGKLAIDDARTLDGEIGRAHV